MKRLFIFILSLYSFLQTNGQNIDKTYYLLGTLQDYGGRHYAKNNPLNWGYLTLLNEWKLGEIGRIEEVAKKRFRKHRKLENFFKFDGFYELKSFRYARRINSFYIFEKRKGVKDRFGFAFYTGTLNCTKLMNSSEIQQLSFIAGLFLVSGEKRIKTYSITLYNSPDRFECVKKILQKLGTKIEKVETDNKIPTKYYLEFKASEKIQRIIENEILKKNLHVATNFE